MFKSTNKGKLSIENFSNQKVKNSELLIGGNGGNNNGGDGTGRGGTKPRVRVIE